MHLVQTPVLGLREAKKATTRRDLTRAARALALEHGLDGVTVEQVCSEVGVSARTFFNYFPGKDAAVLGEVVPVGTEEGRAVFLRGGPTGDLLTDALVLLDPTAVLAAEGRRELRVVLDLVHREPRLLGLAVARGIEQEREVAALLAARAGLPPEDPGCALTACVAQAAVRRASQSWFEDPDGPTLREHLERVRAHLATLTAPAPSDPTTPARGA